MLESGSRYGNQEKAHNNNVSRVISQSKSIFSAHAPYFGADNYVCIARDLFGICHGTIALQKVLTVTTIHITTSPSLVMPRRIAYI